MSHLRKEYSEYKQFKEDMFKEAAELWTEENVILINERLNRNAIYRLNSAIQRFDSKFGKYREQLPAIANILDNAENGLQLVITGKVGSRTTAQMLQRLSIMYNILSNFFGGDLGALLKTPAFRAAHEQPDEKIDKIVDRGHDIKSIRRNLAAALKPNEEERMIFRKAYKSFDMPSLDWNEAAKQLCCLSCNELKDLAGIEKIPMVVVEPENNKIETGMDEQTLGDRVSSAIQTTGKVGSTVAGVAVGSVVGAGVSAAAGGFKSLVNRFKSRSAEMTAAITKLEQYVSGVEGFDNVEKALKSLRDKSKAAANSKFDPDAGVRGLLKHPSVVVMKQAVMASEAIEAILKAWNEHIKDTYKDGIKPEDLPNLKKELVKRVKGGVLSRIKGAITGVKPFPGLSPDDIINAVMNVASQGVGTEEKKEAAMPPSGATSTSGTQESIIVESLKKRNSTLVELHLIVSKMMLTEDYKELEKLIAQIGTFEKSKEGNAETNIEKELQSVNKSITTSQPEAVEKTAVDPSKAAETEAAKENDIAPEDIDTAIGAVTRATEQEIGKDKLDALNKAIADLQISNVNDANSASKFLITYKSLLTKDIEIGQLINILANNVPQTQSIQEQRIVAVKTLKRIILEMVNPTSFSPLPFSSDAAFRRAEEKMAKSRAAEQELERRINPKPNVRLANPKIPTTPQQNPPVIKQPTIPVGTPTAKPAEITPNALNQAVTNANTVEKNPQAVSVVDSQIKALEIPGITDVASVVKFVNDYISIVGKMKEVKELLALLKDVSDVNKYPKVAVQPQATTTTSSPPAATQTTGSGAAPAV